MTPYEGAIGTVEFRKRPGCNAWVELTLRFAVAVATQQTTISPYVLAYVWQGCRGSQTTHECSAPNLFPTNRPYHWCP